MKPLTKTQARTLIARTIARYPYTAHLDQLVEEHARQDAVGRLSKHDRESFYTAAQEMHLDGAIILRGASVLDAERERERKEQEAAHKAAHVRYLARRVAIQAILHDCPDLDGVSGDEFSNDDFSFVRLVPHDSRLPVAEYNNGTVSVRRRVDSR